MKEKTERCFRKLFAYYYSEMIYILGDNKMGNHFKHKILFIKVALECISLYILVSLQ